MFALLVGVLAFVAAGCGGVTTTAEAAPRAARTSQARSRSWRSGAGDEQESFEAVIDGFNELYPNVNVKYTSGGDNLAPLLSTAVEGGNPPDIAADRPARADGGLRRAGRAPVDRRHA